jgi:hypothetical protein
LVHDELIVHSWLGLRKEICITDWRFESELKKPENNQFQLNVAADYPKYPDALFKLIAFEEERLCAFEYERSEKSLMRYRSILIRYSAIRSLWLLLIVYESETIRYRISSQLKRLNDPFLKSRLALVDKQSWLQSPARAPITLADKRFCLLELSSMYESTKAKKVVT